MADQQLQESERRFRFTISSERPTHRVACLNCPWGTKGNNVEAWAKADAHVCQATDDTFGGRARARRRQLNMTQKFVAAALGRTQAWVSYIEAGQREPSLDDLAALATLLNVTTDWLIHG